MLKFLNLKLFAEGGESGGEGSDAGNVNPTAEGGSASTGEQPALSEYDEFIKAHKEEDDKRIQGIVQRRLKGAKATEEKLQKAQTALNMLAGKYQVNTDDIDAITEAIQNDDSLYEQKAMERGVSTDVEKYIQKLERETAANEILIRQQAEQAEQERIIAQWQQQTEEAQKIYPAFDFKTEMENETFRRLIAVPGVSMATAYEVIHPEVVRGRTAAQIADNIKAKGQRPSESGAAGNPGAQAKVDIKNATKEQLAEWSERARRGEQIDFVTKF